MCEEDIVNLHQANLIERVENMLMIKINSMLINKNKYIENDSTKKTKCTYSFIQDCRLAFKSVQDF